MTTNSAGPRKPVTATCLGHQDGHPRANLRERSFPESDDTGAGPAAFIEDRVDQQHARTVQCRCGSVERRGGHAREHHAATAAHQPHRCSGTGGRIGCVVTHDQVHKDPTDTAVGVDFLDRKRCQRLGCLGEDRRRARLAHEQSDPVPISTRRFRWYIPALVREPSQAILIQTRLDNDPGSDSVRKNRTTSRPRHG